MADMRVILEWYAAMGADEAILDTPVDRFAASRPAPSSHAPPAGRANATPPRVQRPAEISARELARTAATLAELETVVREFNGCPLKATATKTVFGDGNPNAAVMFIGEAPGADEDRQGKPFVGVSGQLLDRMLAFIGLDRGKFWITNILPWRPPGNRNPTAAEITLCLPFVERQIELIRPRVLVFVGGTSAKALTGSTDGIIRTRGRWLEYRQADSMQSIPAIAIYHPAYLLRQPAQKRDAWRDLLMLKARLDAFGAAV